MLPLDNHVQVIHPDSQFWSKNPKQSLTRLSQKLSHLIPQSAIDALIDEWCIYEMQRSSIDLPSSVNDLDLYWKHVGDLKNSTGYSKFPKFLPEV